MSSPSAFSEAQQQARQDSCTGTATALTVLSILIVSLRTFTRSFIVRNFGKDDVAMLAALVFTIGYLVTIFILKDNGMGFSGSVLTLEQMTNQLKTTLAIEIIYYLTVFTIKLSILFFYLRIAADKKLALAIRGTVVFLSVLVIICIIVCFVQCVPLHKMWDFTGLVAGKCIVNTTAFFYATSAFNIITDIWILALPIPTLLKIQRPRREKLALVVIFGLGTLSCIASIVRLYTQSSDPFYDSVPVNLWSMVEVNIGIYCASIPSLKALVNCSTHRERNRSTGAYHYHSRDKSGGQGSGKPKPSENSSSDRSHGDSAFAPESYDMKPLPTPPARAANTSSPRGHRSGSEESILSPGADMRV